MTKEFVTERLKLIDLYPDKAREVAKEYGLKEDEVELIRKGRVSSQPVIDRDARTVINYISTDAIDRDNEVIEHRGVVLDDYVKNPIVPWAHDYRGLPIGKNLWIKPDKKGLVAKTYFLKHDFAEDVFDLYTEDIKGTGPALNAWSVGFIPLKWKDAKPDEKVAEDERPQTVRRTYKKWMLLEYSAVPVPSNPEALTLMVEKGLIKNEKLKKDIEDFIVEIEKKDKVIHKEDLVGGENTPDHITVTDLTESAKEVITKLEEESIAFKPYPNEHACRINPPDKYDRIRRVNCGQKHDGKCIDVIYGVKDNKSEIQALRYKTDIWDVAAAKNHCKTREGTFEPASKAETEKEPKELFPKEEQNKSFSLDEIYKIVKKNKELKEKLAGIELKAGAVLNKKNKADLSNAQKLVQNVLDSAEIVEPLEPPKEESILPLIEDNKGKENITDINSLTKDDVPVIVEETIKGVIEAMSGQHKEIQKIFDKSRGKVN